MDDYALFLEWIHLSNDSFDAPKILWFMKSVHFFLMSENAISLPHTPPDASSNTYTHYRVSVILPCRFCLTWSTLNKEASGCNCHFLSSQELLKNQNIVGKWRQYNWNCYSNDTDSQTDQLKRTYWLSLERFLKLETHMDSLYFPVILEKQWFIV